MNKATIAISFLIILSILLWGYFLKASKFDLLEIIKITDLKQTLQILTSTNFVLFILLFPLTFAIIFALTQFLEKEELRLIAIIGGIIGLAASMLAFSNSLNMAIIGAFYLLGLLLAIETAYMKLQELKNWVTFRMIADASQKAMLLVGIGIFIFTAISVLPSQQKYLNEMEKSIVGLISKDSFGAGLNESLSSVFISTQKQSLEQLTNNTYYTDLQTLQDPKAIAYVTFVDTVKQKIDSPEYKQEVIAQISANQNQLSQGQNVELVFDKLKQSLPFYSIIQQYFWLFAAFILVSFYFLIGNIIIRPLTILYGMILHQLFKIGLKK